MHIDTIGLGALIGSFAWNVKALLIVFTALFTVSLLFGGIRRIVA